MTTRWPGGSAGRPAPGGTPASTPNGADVVLVPGARFGAGPRRDTATPASPTRGTGRAVRGEPGPAIGPIPSSGDPAPAGLAPPGSHCAGLPARPGIPGAAADRRHPARAGAAVQGAAGLAAGRIGAGSPQPGRLLDAHPQRAAPPAAQLRLAAEKRPDRAGGQPRAARGRGGGRRAAVPPAAPGRGITGGGADRSDGGGGGFRPRPGGADLGRAGGVDPAGRPATGIRRRCRRRCARHRGGRLGPVGCQPGPHVGRHPGRAPGRGRPRPVPAPGPPGHRRRIAPVPAADLRTRGPAQHAGLGRGELAAGCRLALGVPGGLRSPGQPGPAAGRLRVGQRGGRGADLPRWPGGDRGHPHPLPGRFRSHPGRGRAGGGGLAAGAVLAADPGGRRLLRLAAYRDLAGPARAAGRAGGVPLVPVPATADPVHGAGRGGRRGVRPAGRPARPGR